MDLLPSVPVPHRRFFSCFRKGRLLWARPTVTSLPLAVPWLGRAVLASAQADDAAISATTNTQAPRRSLVEARRTGGLDCSIRRL